VDRQQKAGIGWPGIHKNIQGFGQGKFRITPTANRIQTEFPDG
jgi:hypothetical protein